MFSEAKEFLLFSENKLSVAFSKLHSKRILHIFDRSKPRLYRLLDPGKLPLSSFRSCIENIDKIGSDTKLILDCLRILFKNSRLRVVHCIWLRSLWICN